jgi:receptor-type tyrosine-protein phosphatase zeta
LTIFFQDPLPSTAEDFWRMVIEHNVCTMVMLSADCAWNYWEEEKEAKYGSMRIRLNNTEKLPSYVKREFTVFNDKVRLL